MSDNNNNITERLRIRIRTDIAAFELELKRFARIFQHPRVQSVYISEWQNGFGQPIERDRDGIELVAISPEDGRLFSTQFSVRLNDWRTHTMIGLSCPSIWVRRLSNDWIGLEVDRSLIFEDFATTFVENLLAHCRETWEVREAAHDVHVPIPPPPCPQLTTGDDADWQRVRDWYNTYGEPVLRWSLKQLANELGRSYGRVRQMM